ncbi:MAG TPA: family 43 glycosylhydrolase, partial [Polyangiaceae bacterium]|nr:family 43 glycosylhydrolase [Polyangiaceae bacterium]
MRRTFLPWSAALFALACGGANDSADHAGAGRSAANAGTSALGGGGKSSAQAGSGGSQGGTGASSAGSGTGGTMPNGTGGDAMSSGGAPSSGGMAPNGAGRSGRAGSGNGGTGATAATGGDSPGGMAGTSPGAGGAAQAGASGDDKIVTFTNGGYWNDTDGNRIEAHGAGVIKVGTSWYWIGEDKSANSGNFKAVNCYKSDDLVTWEFRHAIITKQTSTDLNASDRIIERPKVIYNETTKKFVMWLHWDGANYATAEAGVFTSDTVDGDYQQVQHFRPNKNMSRDDTLFKDDDGKAYFLSAANENADLALYELTDDYTDMKRQVSTLWAGSSREAPAIMKANGRYFIVNSGATGWDSNQQKYATA